MREVFAKLTSFAFLVLALTANASLSTNLPAHELEKIKENIRSAIAKGDFHCTVNKSTQVSGQPTHGSTSLLLISDLLELGNELVAPAPEWTLHNDSNKRAVLRSILRSSSSTNSANDSDDSISLNEETVQRFELNPSFDSLIKLERHFEATTRVIEDGQLTVVIETSHLVCTPKP